MNQSKLDKIQNTLNSMKITTVTNKTLKNRKRRQKQRAKKKLSTTIIIPANGVKRNKFVPELTQTKNITNTLALRGSEVRTPYLKALMFPETAVGARLPSIRNQLTATFHRHITLKAQTNAGGNMVWIFNPFFLGAYSTALPAQGTFTYNNLAALDLINPNTSGWNIIPMASEYPPLGTYDSYRLVSASLRTLANCSLTNANGVMGQGTTCVVDPNGNDFMGTSANTPVYTNYTTQIALDQMDDFLAANVAKQEELRHIWYPPDSASEEFVQIQRARSSLFGGQSPSRIFVGYASAIPSNCYITFEIDLNFECCVPILSKGYIPIQASEEAVNPGLYSRVIGECAQHRAQVGFDISGRVAKEEESFWALLKNAGSAIGKSMLKWLPTLLT